LTTKEEELDTDETKKKTTRKKDLKTLVELVENSNISLTLIIMELSRTGYLTQFYEEKEKLMNGLKIEPSMSEKDFEKIMKE